ncbi:hypothetical protein GOP47_0001613 [Adiantum capillus-veneris]|uniref:Exostosin GT47 domain-containing protein n=1 Tax=Adiantum capillus-veneris TaxID=13818 RepID=A0A9D4V8L0_ADICA|nr:hypothetical protein GOP47_0001613 [Adiantum capillus-veneris]
MVELVYLIEGVAYRYKVSEASAPSVCFSGTTSYLITFGSVHTAPSDYKDLSLAMIRLICWIHPKNQNIWDFLEPLVNVLGSNKEDRGSMVLKRLWHFISPTQCSSISRQMGFFQETFQGPGFLGDSEFSDLNESSLETIERCDSPLRVYMYDIPRKFNLGMIKQGSNEERPWRDAKVPSWPMNSGLKRQHSVEYWMMLSLLNQEAGKSLERVALRVADPLEADLFFMPFFSSLSFNKHGVNMLDPETEKDRLLQVEVEQFLKTSRWWLRSGAVAWLGKDIVAPYNHMVETFVNDNSSDPFKVRSTLLFFRGQTRRKDQGKVRMKLANLLQNHSMVVYEESTAKNGGVELSTEGMRSSRFCLHPAGDTPSSCRLFDAIVSHCVPVIVSDRIELPFEDELNYREFCLFFSTEEALRPGYMLSVLERFPKRRWMKMWRKLKLVSHHFEYQYPVKKDDAVSMIWKQARRKLPSVRLAIHRSQRLKVSDWWHW